MLSWPGGLFMRVRPGIGRFFMAGQDLLVFTWSLRWLRPSGDVLVVTTLTICVSRLCRGAV